MAAFGATFTAKNLSASSTMMLTSHHSKCNSEKIKKKEIKSEEVTTSFIDNIKNDKDEILPLTELLLIYASRHEHVLLHRVL